ncbi:hypothetical protein ACR0ST_07130 [Aliidiomarina sp. Khilg15.8]
MNLLIRWLVLTLAVASLLYVSGSQSTHTAYWRAVFNQAPGAFAYPASAYGVGEASHFLGDIYWRRGQRAASLSYYQRAVAQGDAGAAYALSRHVPAQSQQWLRAAAELGDREASLTVADALREESPQEAFALIAGLEQGLRQRDLLASLLIRDPQLDRTSSWRQVAPDNRQWNRRRRAQRQLQPLQELDCAIPVTVYNASSGGNEALYDWLAELSEHQLDSLDMCFALGIFPSLDCTASQGRAYCESDELASEGYQWFITDSGIANARSTQLYLPVDASFDVLVHELAHWFGLADEYPMSADLATLFCSGRYRFDAQNIVVTASRRLSEEDYQRLLQRLPWQPYVQQPIATKDHDGRYRLGSADSTQVGLFAAETCQQAEGYFAWKPVASKTFMEHHDVGAVPPLYIKLMRQYADNKKPAP